MTETARLSDQTDPTGGDLRRRLIAARSLAEVAGERLPPARRGALAEVLGRARGRLTVSGRHTVVALAGPTGVGKSSLFNALLEVDLATVGVTRPTTGVPLAAVVSADPVSELMVHLGLDSWQHVAVSAHPELDSLVLLDLPDHDSVRTAHRERAAAMVAVADRLVWVVDPEKYADASVHQDLLVPLRAHGGVLTVVVNRVDRLDASGRDRVVGDLRRLLADAGLEGAEVIATSVHDPASIDVLREQLAASVGDHRAAGDRIVADLRQLGRQLADEVPPDGGSAQTRRRHQDVVDAAMVAAGAPSILDAVAANHRHRARRATGWPVSRRWQARGRAPLA
ncbi:GTPase, partial [Salsipaludibacter albus]|uniref:GTPase n=1 Tax=Salsipaludibacter albus TaxID=2849650 RepID=UPI001EE4DA59|nr:50S ribosome-binding GTPase [Salsipaludibacter albus]